MRALVCAAIVISSMAFAQDDDMSPEKPAKPKGELDVSKMTFSPSSVRQVMTHNNDKIQGCYEETLAGKDKPIEGTLMTSFVVTAEGMVKGAKVLKKGTTLSDDKLHTCVVAALSAMTFPKPSDKRDHPIEYPFNLKAVK